MKNRPCLNFLLSGTPTTKEKCKADSVNQDQPSDEGRNPDDDGRDDLDGLLPIVLYSLLTFTNYTANPNIILTTEPLDQIL